MCCTSVSPRSQARFMWCDRRDVLDSSEKACWRRRGSDARSDGEDSEKSGGLCEHGVGVFCGFVEEVVGIRRYWSFVNDKDGEKRV